MANAASNITLTATVAGNDMTIAIPENEVNLELDSTGSLDSASADIVVTTSAPYGYTLFMTADRSSLTRTEAVGANTPFIPTLESNSSAMSFEPNHWGFRTASDTVYHPFDNNGTRIGYTDGPVTDNTETVTFAAKVDANTPTGVYRLDLEVSAVANPKPASIEDLTFMQDFVNLDSNNKTSVITSMTKETSYTLKDYRDNQDYTISSLNDGKVWMTKNLNLAGGTTLTPEYSNVASEYILPESSSQLQQNSLLYNSENATCGNGSGIQGTCYSYYSYNIATAGSNPSSGEDATADICPAGWRLPTADEFRAFITSYPNPNSVGPFQLVYGGGFYDYVGYLPRDAGNYAYYWTSTKADANNANYASLTLSRGFNVNNAPAINGYSIRCILK